MMNFDKFWTKNSFSKKRHFQFVRIYGVILKSKNRLILKFQIDFEILTSKVKLSQKVIWPDIHPMYNFNEFNYYLVKSAIWPILDQNIHKLRKSNWFQVVNFCNLIFLPHAHTIIYFTNCNKNIFVNFGFNWPLEVVSTYFSSLNIGASGKINFLTFTPFFHLF